jgi:hypothetical protein
MMETILALFSQLNNNDKKIKLQQYIFKVYEMNVFVFLKLDIE